jgi:hypothetical protein
VSVAEQITDAQERVLTEMEAAQKRVIEMNQRVAEAMVGLMPNNEMVKLPGLPGMDAMPEPTELVDRYFDFTSKMADANRAFYKEMLAVWTPKEEAPAKAPKKAAKKSTKKAS